MTHSGEEPWLAEGTAVSKQESPLPVELFLEHFFRVLSWERVLEAAQPMLREIQPLQQAMSWLFLGLWLLLGTEDPASHLANSQGSQLKRGLPSFHGPRERT